MNTLNSVLKNFISVLILLDAIALNPAYGTDSIQGEVPTWTGEFVCTATESPETSTSGGSGIGPSGTLALSYLLDDYIFRSGWENRRTTERNGALGSPNLIDTSNTLTSNTFTGSTIACSTIAGSTITAPTTMSLACIPQSLIS